MLYCADSLLTLLKGDGVWAGMQFLTTWRDFSQLSHSFPPLEPCFLSLKLYQSLWFTDQQSSNHLNPSNAKDKY